jgi:tetratricopeptide (TPR) repeat protein
LVRLCAPPGYGKSSLTRLLARRFDRHGICDCSGVTGVADFAARALSALEGESPAGGESASYARLRLHATEADAAGWSRALLEAWKARREHALFVLEHTEAIAGNAAVLSLLGDLLAARPEERVVLIASRDPLSLRFTHYLAPHQILTLTSAELCFDAEEARNVFEGTELAPELIERITRLAGGRPVVLHLLALFAQYDADIAVLIERLETVAADDLHSYLVNEVLSGFTPEMTSTLLATAAIPGACLEDISAATGIRHATAVMERLLHLPGFISSETGVYHTHPLLLNALRSRHGRELTNALLRAAQQYEQSGDFLRAAELYDVYGDADAAAAALDRLPATTLQQPSSRLIDALVKIPMTTTCKHPNLWIATFPHRRRNVESARLYQEAVRLLHGISPSDAPSLHRRLRVRIAMLAQELEKLDEARTLVEAGGRAGIFDEAPEEQRLLLMTAAGVAAKQGRFAEAEEFVDEADAVQGARHVRFEAERAQIAAEKARFLGDWRAVLKMSEETLYAAQASGVTSRIVEAARTVAQAAWYCNDDARVLAAQQMIEDCGGVPQTSSWHAALETADPEEARRILDKAIDDLDAGENHFLRIVIRVVTALLLPTQRRRLLEGRVIAQHIESPALQASLEFLIDSPEPNDYGIFKHLAARLARSPLKVRRDVLHIDIVRGRMRRGGEAVHVSDRGFELLAALALLPEGTSKEELAAAIWPALDGEAALNTLKMCVSRARAQLGEREAIRSTKSGYALGERVTVDVREFERLLRSVRGLPALSETLRRQLEDAANALAARERSHTAGWAWFETHAAQVEELQHELALALAKDALRRDVVALEEPAAAR